MTNSKTNSKTKENRLNQNRSLSKTDQRKLKPISFCLLDTEQVTMLEKIEKFQYGNFFKNIIKHVKKNTKIIVIYWLLKRITEYDTF